MPKPDVKFVECEDCVIKDYTLIEGFPGMGLVGTIAAKYLVERLKFRDYGYIDSEIFVPIIRIHDGLPVHPSRIYISDEHKLVVLISEQIIPKKFTHAISNALVDWIKKRGVRKVISLSGIHTDTDGGSQTIYGIAANNKSKKMLEQHKVTIIEDGITTGITALMLLALKESDVEAVSILGNVNIAADYKAASELVKKLNEILGLEIDVKPLMKEAKQTEQELLRHMQNVKHTHESMEKMEAKAPSMYT